MTALADAALRESTFGIRDSEMMRSQEGSSEQQQAVVQAPSVGADSDSWQPELEVSGRASSAPTHKQTPKVRLIIPANATATKYWRRIANNGSEVDIE